MRIVELRAENVKRLKAVTIRPDGSLVIIGGRNAQGKTSVIDSIEMLLAGNKALPPDPVRHGAGSARIVADLGELVVEKTITSKGTHLVVRNADGVQQKSPQGILDALCEKIAFDPLEFARMKPTDQDRLLKQVLGLDFSDLEADRQRIYDRRTELNKAAKQHEARADSLPHHPDAPAEEVSITELYAELERRREAVAEVARLGQAVAVGDDDVFASERALKEQAQRVVDLEAQVQLARLQLTRAQEHLDQDRVRLAEYKKEHDAAKETCPDTKEIEAALLGAEETNRKVRENRERAGSMKAADEAKGAAKACTEAIDGIEATKAERLASAKFPVPGLGFGDLGPTLDGVPLEQASDAQRLRLSVAIGLALNPKLKVLLVRDGSRLDDDGMTLLAKLAEEAGAQVWLERVGDRDPCAVVIEDGEVVEAGAAAE
jgi:hypothetical protein